MGYCHANHLKMTPSHAWASLRARPVSNDLFLQHWAMASLIKPPSFALCFIVSRDKGIAVQRHERQKYCHLLEKWKTGKFAITSVYTEKSWFQKNPETQRHKLVCSFSHLLFNIIKEKQELSRVKKITLAFEIKCTSTNSVCICGGAVLFTRWVVNTQIKNINIKNQSSV